MSLAQKVLERWRNLSVAAVPSAVREAVQPHPIDAILAAARPVQAGMPLGRNCLGAGLARPVVNEIANGKAICRTV
jgi:hypothetical protein